MHSEDDIQNWHLFPEPVWFNTARKPALRAFTGWFRAGNLEGKNLGLRSGLDGSSQPDQTVFIKSGARPGRKAEHRTLIRRAMPPAIAHTDHAIPILPARSMESTLAFYRRLGFNVEVASPAGDYAIAVRGTLEIHFFAHAALIPRESAFGCYFRVHDVDALFEAFAAVGLPHDGIPRLTTPEDKPWGMREFALVDENGTLIRIGQER